MRGSLLALPLPITLKVLQPVVPGDIEEACWLDVEYFYDLT
jgi:hypothetical protein